MKGTLKKIMDKRLTEIIDIAIADENIRGVILYGSRACDDIDTDMYQDYDIYYIVNNIDAFSVDVYKDIGLMFIPSDIYSDLFENEKTYLMQFSDYSRIDLTICTYEVFCKQHMGQGAMKCLLNKDNILNGVDTDNNSMNWVKPFDKQSYLDTCSEFFWEVQNMAKGLKRDQISFALFIRDISLRDMLNRMVDVYIGMNNNYRVSVGTLGKYRKKYLPADHYNMYRKTYNSNTYEDCWDSLFSMISLFDILAKKIAEKYNYIYPQEKKDFVMKYLEFVCEN